MAKRNNFLAFFQKKDVWSGIALLLTVVYAAAGSIVSVLRYWQYEAFYFDFGYFDKVIWQVSRFRLPIMDHYALGERIIFVDHFSPTIFLLSALYWITSRPEIIFIAQATIVALGGLVLFFIGKKVLANSFQALCILASYFFFVGLQNAVITDFHEVTLATFFFFLTWWAVLKKHIVLYVVSLILFLGCKESLGLLGAGLGVAIWILVPTWKKIGVATIVVSLIWTWLATHVVIPFFGGGYIYGSEIPTDMTRFVQAFIDSPVKRDTLWYTFFNFGFLPLLSPAFWPLIIADFLMRFYPAGMTTRWGLTFHYSAVIASIMALSCVYAVRGLNAKVSLRLTSWLLLGVVFMSAYLYRVKLHGPFGLAYNPAFYTHTKDFVFLDRLVDMVPEGASVMAQNNIAPHFTHQPVWLLLSDAKKYEREYYTSKNPEYIVIDDREGQGANNHFGVQDMQLLLTHLREDESYEIFYEEGGQYIFKRK